VSSPAYRTEHERFWAGEFGDAYTTRNQDEGRVAANTALLARALGRAGGLGSCLEFGANVGLNLIALRRLLPAAQLAALEINAGAAAALRRLPGVTVFEGSALDFRPERSWDLVLSKGFLIHVAPDELPELYDRLHAATGRYLLVAEYYNPTPVEVPYRGHAGRLFKRDFAGELLERHPDLSLADYGFVYHRDPQFPQDDLTWFLLERAGR